MGLGVVVAAWYLISHFFFPTGVMESTLPETVLRILYISSVVCTVGLSIIFACLFKFEMEQAEAELTASNCALEKLSATDELTQTVNRRGMDAALDREWARMRREGRALSLLMCDVDCFKRYNDHYGHPAGDAVLRRIAGVLKEAARRPSDLVARYGGEEFVVILPDTDESHGWFVGERIVTSV